MSLIMKELRSAAGYRPGKTLVEYEKPKLHHIGRLPTFEQHERVIRALGEVHPEVNMEPNYKPWPGQQLGGRPISGQRRHVVERRVMKTIMSQDGRTPRHPIMILQKNKDTGELEHVLQTTLVPVAAPVRLKSGTPKALYRRLKRMHRNGDLLQIGAEILQS